MTDRFTEAFSELEEKNAFACESCDALLKRDSEAERAHELIHEDPVMRCDGCYD